LRTGECADCKKWGVCQGNSFHLIDPETNHTRICYFKEYELA